MKKLLFVLTLCTLSFISYAQANKDIMDLVVGSPKHTTLVKAIKTADLTSIFREDGPYTVFAPTNEAFGKLQKDYAERLFLPELQDELKGLLNYHVIAGSIDTTALVNSIKQGRGKALLSTLQGEFLTVTMKEKMIMLTDIKGNTAILSVANLKGKNGIIHIIDNVLLP